MNKKQPYFFCLLFSFLFVLNIAGQDPCPPEGSATIQNKKDLNIAKNRSITVDSSQIADFVPLASMISYTKKEDSVWFQNGTYIVTEGYLINAIEEGPESCNCNQAKKSLKNGDVHMFLGRSKNSKTKNCIVIEITPEFKEQHPDYEQLLTLKKKIRVTGYLLYDFIHRKDALMTCKSCTDIWRNNSWEIHPITEIEVL